jgi:hypothetical protein
MTPIPFTTINWDEIPSTEHKGLTGTSFWKTVKYNGFGSGSLNIQKTILLIIGANWVILYTAWKAGSKVSWKMANGFYWSRV